MASKFVGHLRTNVVAYVALFLALSGGTAYAASAKWTGTDIVDESLTGVDIKNGSLGASDISVAASFGSENAGTPMPHVETVLAHADITLARPSTLVVFGQSDGSASCRTPAPGENVCQIVPGLYLDGNPIPDSAGAGLGLFPTDPSHFFDELSMFGVVHNVPAGTHTISTGVGSNSGDDLSVGFRGERVAAIAIPD